MKSWSEFLKCSFWTSFYLIQSGPNRSACDSVGRDRDRAHNPARTVPANTAAPQRQLRSHANLPAPGGHGRPHRGANLTEGTLSHQGTWTKGCRCEREHFQPGCANIYSVLVPTGQILHLCLLSQRLSAVLFHHGGADNSRPLGVWIRHPRNPAGRSPHKRFVQVINSIIVKYLLSFRPKAVVFWQSGCSGHTSGLEGSCEERVCHQGMQPHSRGAGGWKVNCGGGREARGGERLGWGWVQKKKKKKCPILTTFEIFRLWTCASLPIVAGPLRTVLPSPVGLHTSNLSGVVRWNRVQPHWERGQMNSEEPEGMQIYSYLASPFSLGNLNPKSLWESN